MSWITEAVVLGASDEDMAKLNDALPRLDVGRGQQFGRIPSTVVETHSGGTKFFLESIWTAAFNYLSESLIYEAARHAWGEDGLYGVTIITQAEEGDWRMLVPPREERF